MVGIDEVQFFDHSIVDAAESWRLIERVIVAVWTDYRGLPFGPMPDMMCEAEYADKLRAICLECEIPYHRARGHPKMPIKLSLEK